MAGRQALGLLLIFLFLLGGRALRHALLMGDGGRWRDGLWLEGLLPEVEEAQAEPESPPPEGPFDVNTASVDTLDYLPGVGPVLAARIVAEREAGGPFADLEDLQRVKGIGPKLAERLAAHVTFGRNASAPADSSRTAEDGAQLAPRGDDTKGEADRRHGAGGRIRSGGAEPDHDLDHPHRGTRRGRPDGRGMAP